MTEGVLKAKASGGGFPVAPPLKIKVNNGQYGTFAGNQPNDVNTLFVGCPFSIGGHIEYQSKTITYKDDVGNIVWVSGTPFNFVSAPFFHNETGVNYAYLIIKEATDPWGMKLVRFNMLDGAAEQGSSWVDGMSDIRFFTSSNGLHAFVSNKVFDVDMVNLSLTLSPEQELFPNIAANVGMFPTYDLSCGFHEITEKGIATASSSHYYGAYFFAGYFSGGVFHPVKMSIPSLHGVPITSIDANYNNGALTQISANIVMSASYRFSGSFFSTDPNMRSSPSYFDKTDFDRWVKEVVALEVPES